MRPRLALKVGAAPATAQELPLSALHLSRSLNWPVGQATAELSPGTSLPSAGGTITVAGASDGDTLTTLFTGRVLVARPGTWAATLLLEEFTGPLARLHVEKAVSATNAATVMADLCQAASLKNVTTEPPGATLPFLALLRGPSALEHVLKLALMSGQLVRPTASGALSIGMAPTAPTGVQLRPQDPVMDWHTASLEAEEGPALSGDGAQGSKGSGAEHWLLQDISGMTSGSGFARHMPGLKAAGAVAAAAREAASRRKSAAQVRVVTLAGIPPADLGEVISLADFPDGNGAARIWRVDLVYSAVTGLVTTLELHGQGV